LVTRRTVLRGLATMATAAAVPVSPGRKWHPGHYVASAGAANPHVTGVKVCLPWGALEGAPGDYAPGFRLVDTCLSAKHLMVEVQERSCAYPDYVVDNGWVVAKPAGERWRGNLTSTAAMWRPQVMDRLIALSDAFATRYDGHPRFEMFSLGETRLTVPGAPIPAWLTQLKRWFTESKKSWRHTYLRLNANYISNDAEMRDLITHCVAGGGVTVGGPEPERPSMDLTGFITANRVFRGLDGGEDLRGTVPWTGETRALTQTPREVFEYHEKTMHASHMVWPWRT
jgi:hypothetical protein